MPFDLLSDEDQTLLSEWDILNTSERGGIAYPNIYGINRDREVILHSRDKTASRAEPDPIVNFLEEHEEDSSHRKEITNQKFQWPNISSLIWGLPRKLGWIKS